MSFRKLFPNYESLLKSVEEKLQTGEKIIVSTYGASGRNQNKPTLIVATDSRLIRYSRLLLSEQFISCPFDSINLIDESSGFKGKIINVHFLKGFVAFSLSSRARFKESNEKMMKELFARINKKGEKKQAEKTSTTDLLEELESLKNRRLITEEEFQQKRKEILARL